jgi:hypothetical protein
MTTSGMVIFFLSGLVRRMEMGLILTHFRPTRSAMVPLRIAPNIAPMVNIEPKTEYCMVVKVQMVTLKESM